MITVTVPLKIWSGEDGSSHFMTLSEELSHEVRVHAMETPRGFGSVRVEARIDDIAWRTSLFPVKNGGYFLPVKIDVCRRAGIVAGDLVSVTLDLL